MRAGFDVCANPGSHAATTPYLLDVPSALLDGLDSRMGVPLRGLETVPIVKLPTRSTPVLVIHGEEFLLETPKTGAVPRRVLRAPVTTPVQEQDRIAADLDFWFHGDGRFCPDRRERSSRCLRQRS